MAGKCQVGIPVCRRSRGCIRASPGVGATLLQLLETFCAVVDAGSLTKATERLHLTQPAITRQLRSLERELGAVLLTRTPRGVELTPVGRAVLVHAREAVAAVRACQEVASEASAAGALRLRLTAGLMATLYVLPPVIARFRALYPDIEVQLQPTDQRDAVERLLTYEVDGAVIASPVRSPLVRATPILDDPLLLVGRPDAGAGPEARTVRLADLTGTTLLVLASGTGLREQIDEALQEHGVACRLVEYPTAETVKSAVELGMGQTILPASAVQEELAVGRLSVASFSDWPEASRMIHLLVRAAGRPPRPIAAFTDLLKEAYGGRSPGRPSPRLQPPTKASGTR